MIIPPLLGVAAVFVAFGWLLVRVNGQQGRQVVWKRDDLARGAEDELVRVQHGRLVALGLDHARQVRLLDRRVDVGYRWFAKTTEVPVEPRVDAGRLDELGIVGIGLHPAGGDFGPDVAVQSCTLATYRFRYDVGANAASLRCNPVGGPETAQPAGVVQWQNISFPS